MEKNLTVNHRVIKIISEQSGIDISDIFPESRLEDDLKITGDDIWDILNILEHTFTINGDVSAITQHFHPEAAGLFWKIFNQEHAKTIQSCQLTMHHLIRISDKRKWLKPIQAKQLKVEIKDEKI